VQKFIEERQSERSRGRRHLTAVIAIGVLILSNLSADSRDSRSLALCSECKLPRPDERHCPAPSFRVKVTSLEVRAGGPSPVVDDG
jgi:hypothetical protein